MFPVSPVSEIHPEEYRALAEFRYQIRRFLRFSEEAARAAGIEASQHQLLLALKALSLDGRPTIRDLAERLQVRHHSVVGLIDRLVERNLVGRSRGEEDQREVHIHLTDLGESVLRELSIHHRAELQHNGPALVRALQAVIASEGGRDEIL